MSAPVDRGARAPLKLLWMLTQRELRLQYRDTLLGMTWMVLKPLVIVVIYSAVFAGLLEVRFNPDDDVFDFAFYLLCGMAPWTAVHEAVVQGSESITSQGSLVRGHRFPAVVLPLQGALTHTALEIVSLGLLIVGLLATGHPIGWQIVLLPLLVAVRVATTAGLSLFVASLNVVFSDTRHAVSVLMYVWMLLTPIFYPPWVVPREYAVLMTLNPAAHMVGNYRNVIVGGVMPDPASLSIFVGFACFAVLLGSFVYGRVRPHVADLV